MSDRLTLNYESWLDFKRYKKLGVIAKSPLWRRILVWLGFTSFGRWEVHYWYEYVPREPGITEIIMGGTYMTPDGPKTTAQLMEEYK